MALAIYRKYRPKKLEDLLGQEHIVTILQNAAKQERLSHAYLFYGPRGTGKTTAARLVAKLANCATREKDKNFREKGESCNRCDRCAAIDNGQALDVVEIDAASNRGIDEIRALKEGVKLSPTSYPYKVIIIDETHMLTRDAFNALLKTLEEPPAHAILILATTEYEKVPATISSRCQRFHFHKLAIDQIIKKLQIISKAEKFKITEDAIELIAAIAEGSLRDAESVLGQMTSLAEEVSAETVEKTLGQVGFTRIAKLADHILKNDLKGALEYLAKIQEGGHNLVDLAKELIHYFRRILSLRMDTGLEVLFKKEFTGKEMEQLKAHGAAIVPQKHIAFIKSLIRAYSEMRYSPFAVVPLEIAIIENLQNSG
ncbi:MAG: DNA polymerase III subunit gamma/tau [Patescibacteria group bacterium]